MLRRNEPNYVVLAGSIFLIAASVLGLFGQMLIAMPLMFLGAGVTIFGLVQRAGKQRRFILTVVAVAFAISMVLGFLLTIAE